MSVTIKPPSELDQTSKAQTDSETLLVKEWFVRESAQEIIEQLTETIVTKFQHSQSRPNCCPCEIGVVKNSNLRLLSEFAVVDL